MQRILNDLRGALAFLTVIPVGWPDETTPGRTFAYYPLVGLIIGVILALIAQVGGFSVALIALLVLLAWITLTGGLHLDGVGDACDGVLATVEPTRRLEIMKDSRAGSWAVIGLFLLLLGKWIALRDLIALDAPWLLVLPPVIGRWAMVLAVRMFPYARTEGIGGYFRDGFGAAQVTIATAIMLVIVIGAALVYSVLVLIVLVAALIIVRGGGAWIAQRLGGGLTGDVYGALCEITELVCLIILSGIAA